MPQPSASALTLAQARYLLIDQFGPLHYCDPDEYPVPLGDEQQKALDTFATIQTDIDTFVTILYRIGLDGQTSFSDADKLQIYREWKALNAVDATPAADGTGYGFDITTEGDAASGRALRIVGSVDSETGQISVASEEEMFGTSCPICLARGTLIDTPDGPVPVNQLRVGDAMWTVDAAGSRVASSVARVGSIAVPSTHRVVHLVLDDGRTLDLSPGHPLIDGRLAGHLAARDAYDGATVLSAELVDYGGGRTFDVLPAGDTGYYWANEVLVASTLR